MYVDNDKPKPPYVHQDFPAVVYGAKGAHKLVKDAAERDAAVAAGFSTKAPAPEPEPEAEEAPKPAKPAAKK